MKITIVMGFFLPVPPVAGGATEKSWHGLAREFAARGHAVTLVSRHWPGLPSAECDAHIRHLRLRGYAHTSHLAKNLWLDFLWSLRVWFALPEADVTVVNCVALPVWLGWLRRRAGRLVVMPGRIPKGQYRLYRSIDRVLAVSSTVRDAVVHENSRLGAVTKIFGYPIDWKTLAGPRNRSDALITIGYVGRLHTEKGLDLLAAAVELLARQTDLPPWRILLCGPVTIEQGGSGETYVADLMRRLSAILASDRLILLPPEFELPALAEVYRKIDLFCYPSLAVRGETFGVAVVEAMAAGAVPVVSQLPCFTDFVKDGINGEVFDHASAAAPALLAARLADLLRDPARCTRLRESAHNDARAYHFPEFAGRLLADFSTLK